VRAFARKDFEVEYLLFVISQYGPRLVNVYAFVLYRGSLSIISSIFCNVSVRFFIL